MEDFIRTKTDPAWGRMVHEADGITHAQDYGDGSQAIHTVNRNFLNTSLLDEAGKTGRVTFYFCHACTSIAEDAGEIVFTNSKTGESVRKRYDHIIAADGVFSAVRKDLEGKNILSFKSRILEHGYKEMRIPADPQGKHVLDDHRTHVWPRKNSVLLAFPTVEGNFAVNLFMPLVGPDSFESLTAKDSFMAFFKREYAEVFSLMPNLEEDFLRNPVSTLTQVQGEPWNYKDKILIMGDAAHAITPFYGMGMNIGFEDCTVFMDLLESVNYDFGKAFAAFGVMRKPDTDAMTDLSYENFKGINESLDPLYYEKWLLERRIWRLIPERWIPSYVLIAFSSVQLREVPEVKEKQDGILKHLMMENPRILELGDEELRVIAEKAILEQGLGQFSFTTPIRIP